VRFDQFDPVAVQILHVAPLAALDRLVFILNRKTDASCLFEDVWTVIDEEGRVRLACRTD